jgi:hypothetical protein
MLLRWGQHSVPGCARLLDVVGVGHEPDRAGLPADISAAAVTDWTPDTSMLEVLGGTSALVGSPGVPVDTVTALTMLAPLASAAHQAHTQGLVLGCGYPQLLRIVGVDTGAALVHLAFLCPDSHATPAQDVRGLGAVL